MKLYWRVKINGKWTWRPAEVYLNNDSSYLVKAYKGESDES